MEILYRRSFSTVPEIKPLGGFR